MRRPALTLLVVFCLAFGLIAQAPARQTQPPKPEDIQKNLVLVETTQPVPDRLKAGFEAITAKDSIAMLTYIASDLLEGRDTATRGYQLAAEYAASLMALWKLKPGGDQPRPDRMMMGMRFGDEPPRPAPERRRRRMPRPSSALTSRSARSARRGLSSPASISRAKCPAVTRSQRLWSSPGMA